MAVKLMYLQAVICAVAALLLIAKKIARPYKWLIVYLLAQTALSIPGALLYRRPNAYGWFYYYSAVLNWLPALGAAIEGYSHLMHKHRGIERLGRRALYVALVCAFALSGIILLKYRPETTDAGELFRIGSSVELLVRTAYLIFWTLLLAFMICFPVSLSRNTVVLSITFATYFLVTAGATFAYMSAVGTGVTRPWVGIWRSAFVVLCQLTFGLALTHQGETKMVRVGHRWNPSEEAKLLAQLDAINEHLMSTSRAR
jgi:hypothetical protein